MPMTWKTAATCRNKKTRTSCGEDEHGLQEIDLCPSGTPASTGGCSPSRLGHRQALVLLIQIASQCSTSLTAHCPCCRRGSSALAGLWSVLRDTPDFQSFPRQVIALSCGKMFSKRVLGGDLPCPQRPVIPSISAAMLTRIVQSTKPGWSRCARTTKANNEGAAVTVRAVPLVRDVVPLSSALRFHVAAQSTGCGVGCACTRCASPRCFSTGSPARAQGSIGGAIDNALRGTHCVIICCALQVPHTRALL